MILSQTGEYALQAVLYLAGRGPGGPVGAADMANALGVPASYLSKTLQILVRAGVLASTRGRSGGFALAVAPHKLLLVTVIAPFDADSERRHCLLGRGVCSDRSACAAHHAWKPTADAIAGFFRTTTVAEFGKSSSRRDCLTTPGPSPTPASPARRAATDSTRRRETRPA